MTELLRLSNDAQAACSQTSWFCNQNEKMNDSCLYVSWILWLHTASDHSTEVTKQQIVSVHCVRTTVPTNKQEDGTKIPYTQWHIKNVKVIITLSYDKTTDAGMSYSSM